MKRASAITMAPCRLVVAAPAPPQTRPQTRTATARYAPPKEQLEMPRARRHCPGSNSTCTNLISSSESYCPEHQPEPWVGRTTGQGSTRASRAERDQCLRDAGYQCQLKYEGCTGHATHADHIVNIASTGTPRAKAIGPKHKLQAACPSCHTIKTRAEAAAARRQQTAQQTNRRKR